MAMNKLQATLSSFLLVPRLYPDVRPNRVVGRMHLPTFKDRPENLPLVEPIYKELLHWQVVFWLDIPHSAIENERVSQGKIVLPNTW